MSDHPSDGSPASTENPPGHEPAPTATSAASVSGPNDGPDVTGADGPADAATDRTTDKKVF
jgi:hypothetical protein